MEGWRLEVGSWRVRGWKLEVGEFEVGSWRVGGSESSKVVLCRLEVGELEDWRFREQ